MHDARLTALSVAVPRGVRTNDYWRTNHPELVAHAEERSLARVFSSRDEPTTAFDRAMRPFETDPFRGSVRRRVCGPDEDSVTLEADAARQALDAACLGTHDVDLLISTGFIGRQYDVGNAVLVARDLGLKGAAFNLESACGGPMNALITAFALVRSGQFRRVLVTASCTYTARAREEESLSWFMGDGGGAFLVERGTTGAELLAGTSFHTADTCGTWFQEPELYRGELSLAMRAHPCTGPVMRATAEPHLRRARDEALQRAGLEPADLDFVVVHTPTAWFADFASEAFDFPRDRTVDTYPEYGNIGPALSAVNLHFAAATDRLGSGSRVLHFGPGSSGSTGALIWRWGAVSLGPLPEAP